MKDRKTLDFKGLYGAILKDCAAAFPRLQLSFQRDFEHLSKQVDQRGSTVLTIELPDLGKHFDYCLSKGKLTASGLPNSRNVSSRIQFPRLFSGLYQLVFDSAGLLLIEPDITAIALLRQLYYAAKKVRLTCAPSRTYKAIKEFYDDEKDLPHPTLRWNDDEVFRSGDTRHISFRESLLPLFEGERHSGNDVPSISMLDTLQRVADLVSSSFGEFIPSEWRGKHGPGAVSEQFELSKFEFPSWPAALEKQFPMDEFAHASLSIGIDSRNSDAEKSSRSEPVSAKLIAVPKTQKTPRLIASEPIANQFMQQLILKYLRSELQNSMVVRSIDFSNQAYSKEAARRASITGAECTIDLKSASDRLSCWVVERCFRKNTSLLNALHSTRTRYVRNEIDKKSPSCIEIKKYAMMGNATTFPVQSIVYTILAIAACHIHTDTPVTRRSILRKSSRVTVYGDDIIMPREAFPVMEQILSYLWLKVNTSKTFTTGNFRESCGMDAYGGQDVTPAYYLTNWDESHPSSLSSLVECSNNFFMKGFWHTADWIKRSIPRRWLDKLPVLGPGARCLSLLTFSGDTFFGPTRFDEDLQKWMTLIPILANRVNKSEPAGEHSLHQYFTDDPSPDVQWTHGEVSSKRSFLRLGWRPVEAVRPL